MPQSPRTTRFVAALCGILGLGLLLACGDDPATCPTGDCDPVPGPGLPLTYRISVVDSFPKDPLAFTQGLVIDAGELFEGTGLYGRSTLRLVDRETGTVLRSITLPSAYFGEGIHVDGDRIVQLTWRERRAFVWDRDTFAPVDTFSYEGEGWGITGWKGDWMMSNGSSRLALRDPDTFDTLRTMTVREMLPDSTLRAVPALNELETVRGMVWANVYQTNRIAMIDGETGYVTAWIDLTGLKPIATCPPPLDVLNGIAWDRDTDRVYVTGKRWCWLYEIDLVLDPPDTTGS